MYTCRVHGLPLTTNQGTALCPECNDMYQIEGNIWLLDVVRRQDRISFDEQVKVEPVPLDLSKAERHMKVAAVDQLQRATILDVGCGLGDMTQSLGANPHICQSDIYAFDHSVESVRLADANITKTANGNRVHFSTQDASRLFFAESSFDFVVGSAVLHHFTDWRTFLTEVFRILKPGCRAVFSEPFLEGYFWPCFFLNVAVRELSLQNLDTPDLGMTHFMLENTTYRLQHADDMAALDPLTDKHYFRNDTFSAAALEIGYKKVWFENAEGSGFYDNWMAHFLDVYQVRHEAVRWRAIQLYNYLREYAGPSLPGLVSHFKYMVLQK